MKRSLQKCSLGLLLLMAAATTHAGIPLRWGVTFGVGEADSYQDAHLFAVATAEANCAFSGGTSTGDVYELGSFGSSVWVAVSCN